MPLSLHAALLGLALGRMAVDPDEELAAAAKEGDATGGGNISVVSDQSDGRRVALSSDAGDQPGLVFETFPVTTDRMTRVTFPLRFFHQVTVRPGDKLLHVTVRLAYCANMNLRLMPTSQVLACVFRLYVSAASPFLQTVLLRDLAVLLKVDPDAGVRLRKAVGNAKEVFERSERPKGSALRADQAADGKKRELCLVWQSEILLPVLHLSCPEPVPLAATQPPRLVDADVLAASVEINKAVAQGRTVSAVPTSGSAAQGLLDDAGLLVLKSLLLPSVYDADKENFKGADVLDMTMLYLDRRHVPPARKWLMKMRLLLGLLSDLNKSDMLRVLEMRPPAPPPSARGRTIVAETREAAEARERRDKGRDENLRGFLVSALMHCELELFCARASPLYEPPNDDARDRSSGLDAKDSTRGKTPGDEGSRRESGIGVTKASREQSTPGSPSSRISLSGLSLSDGDATLASRSSTDLPASASASGGLGPKAVWADEAEWEGEAGPDDAFFHLSQNDIFPKTPRGVNSDINNSISSISKITSVRLPGAGERAISQQPGMQSSRQSLSQTEGDLRSRSQLDRP